MEFYQEAIILIAGALLLLTSTKLEGIFLNAIIWGLGLLFIVNGTLGFVETSFRTSGALKICNYELKKEHDYRKLNDCIEYYKKIPYSVYSDVWKLPRGRRNKSS